MRAINRIVIHCSATQPKKDITAATIDKWHREQGWLKIGYHYVIKADGSLEIGRDIEEPGAHAKGFNKDSIGICMVGGVDTQGKSVNNFSRAQFKMLRNLIWTLLQMFPHLDIQNVVGHRDLPNVAKDCPCFDVQKWVAEEQIA